MGASLDWERERYSMDAVITKATYAAFIRLFDEGLIYRGKRMVNWDPHLHTAISDLEVSTESAAGHLWYLRYPIVNSSEYIVVATTRPETLLGDVAVAVHPEDPRYQALIGKTILLPLTQREIPIIGDTAVDSEFGTGCVKITPAHDFNDYEMGKRHQLPVINIFTLSADLNENVPKNYRGLGRVAARKQVVADMEAQGLLEKVENYTVNLPRGDRSGVILEPMLTDQWYVRMNEMAQSAIDAAHQSRPAFVPENWNKTYLQWLNNIEDWCISRQLWWGHRVPVWYDQNQKPYPGYDEADVRKRYSLSADTRLRQDEDILDTWFTAALYPFSTLHWPDQTPELKTFYPGQVMVTGFDIIFFWVARMVMMGLKLMGDIPFQEVYIHGLVRDQQGQKMSKSKGNILDPIDLMDGIDLETLISKRTTGLMQPQMAPAIKKTTTAEFPQGIAAYGADALRLTFCALATTGRDINFDMNRISGYRNFCNKLWNAARYVLMNTENKDLDAKNIQYSLADRWIRSQLQTTIAQVNAAFAEYRFDIIAQLVYEFTWNEYCDWYLELSKPVLTDTQADPALQRGARRTLLEILETLLRLLHPLIPFITEEIWQTVAPMIQGSPAKSIMIAPYPQADSRQQDPQAIAAIDWLKQVVNGIRNVRGEMRVAPGKLISVFFHKGSEQDRQYSRETEILIKNLAKVDSLTWLAEDASPSPASTVIVLGQLEVIIPLADLVDKNAELVRLQKEIDKLKREQEKLSSRLENADYTQKAPAAVVEKERQNFQQITATLDKLQSNYQKIKEL
jgi:valyl-tRNA synthetase